VSTPFGVDTNTLLRLPGVDGVAERLHWEIKNRLHWCLGVQFGEAPSTMLKGYTANNLAIIRHIAMNLLRLNTSRKGSVKTKRMPAATYDTFRAELLFFMM
jgi:predicted transposase YbfD/YdcC